MLGRLRDNAFLAAAVALPLVVVGVFLLLTAIPKWTVPPPQYDLLLKTTEYERVQASFSVDLFLRDEALHVTLRADKGTGHSRVRLWRFDHATLNAREVQLNLPAQAPAGDQPQTFVVESLRGQRIVTDARAPDGYQLRERDAQGPGVVGEIFGMRRYGQSGALVNRGRVIPIEIPGANHYEAPAFIGWVVNGGVR